MSKSSINIEVHSLDHQLDSELFNNAAGPGGREAIISDGLKLEFQNKIWRFSEETPSIFQLALHISKYLPAAVAALRASTWLYSKLKGRRIKKVLIEKTEVEFDKNKIKKLIHEKLEMEQ